MNLKKIRNEILQEAKLSVLKFGWNENLFINIKNNSKFKYEEIIALFPENSNFYYVVASNKGKGFIANIEYIKTNQKKGKQLFNLKKGDKVLKVLCLNHSHIACVNNSSKLLIFETKQLPILQKGIGVQIQKIKENEFLSDIRLFNLNDGLSWYNGSIKRCEKNLKLWLGKRSQSGKKIPKKFNKDLKFHEKII